jgi:hypothetical protein
MTSIHDIVDLIVSAAQDIKKANVPLPTLEEPIGPSEAAFSNPAVLDPVEVLYSAAKQLVAACAPTPAYVLELALGVRSPTSNWFLSEI